MLSSPPRPAPPIVAIMLAGASVIALAGCGAGGDAAKSTSDLSREGRSMVKVGDASREAGDCQAAIRFYRLVKSDNPTEAEAASIGTAECELGMGAVAAAEHDYQAALKLAPGNPVPLIGLGRVYLVAHQPGQAASYFDQAIKKGDVAPYVWNDKGVAYDQLRRHKEAQQAYRQGLAKTPTDWALRNNLALSLAMTRQFKEAETLLRALVDEPTATARTRENLALVLGLEGDGDDARRVSQNDLDGAALDNNSRFYQYARSAITGEPLASSTASVDAEDDAPAAVVRAAAPVPPPVLVTKRQPLKALRPAEPARLETKPAIAQTNLPAPAKPTTADVAATQTAALPPAAAAKSAPASGVAPPTRIVASDGGAPKSQKPTAPPGAVASSENQ